MIKQQLKKIVFGLVFILINFNIQFDGGGFLNLLPNFVGYLVIYSALGILITETNSLQFVRTRKFSFIMFLISVVLFSMDLIGVTAALSSDLAMISFTIAIVSLALQLLFLYFLTLGIMSITSDPKLSRKLQTTFRFVAIGNVLVYLLIVVDILALLVLIMTLVANIVYIVTIHQISKTHS